MEKLKKFKKFVIDNQLEIEFVTVSFCAGALAVFFFKEHARANEYLDRLACVTEAAKQGCTLSYNADTNVIDFIGWVTPTEI